MIDIETLPALQALLLPVRLVKSFMFVFIFL